MTDRRAEIEVLLHKTRKKLGNDDLVFLGSDLPEIEHLPTGWLGLDYALNGGFPKNQWTEIIGLEHHGKTAVTLKALAHNQRLDPEFWCCWIAAEEYNADFAEMCGVDNERVVLIDTNVMEDAYDAIVEFADSRAVDMIVLDSYPALVPISEDEGAMGDFQVSIGARLTGKWTRKARKSTRRSAREEERAITGIFINQWRTDVGTKYGDPRTTPGGTGKNYFFYTRVEVRRDEWIVKGKDRRGIRVQARPIKHKAGRPEIRASVDFFFDEMDGHLPGSYDEIKDAVGVAIASGAAELRGNTYNFGGRKFVGRAKFDEAVRDDPALREEIRQAILKPHLLEPLEAEEVVEEEEPPPAKTTKKAASRRKLPK